MLIGWWNFKTSRLNSINFRPAKILSMWLFGNGVISIEVLSLINSEHPVGFRSTNFPRAVKNLSLNTSHTCRFAVNLTTNRLCIALLYFYLKNSTHLNLASLIVVALVWPALPLLSFRF